ncbi:hypothetical protein LSTR_LSTR011725 [Laodelphax striatellus]|uniref:FAM86 N-terminal domain-containing protein n=1 Tax=Laodelphax striatellus TaxID=195883 RepID=A0A482WLW6_LAOST|nr:hypothetical protein LSTR_LSTR011725 [Laodelphax striatellus]
MNQTDQISVLELLFLSATNLNNFKWDDLLALFDCNYSESQENQVKLLERTVNHSLVKKYPLKLSYQQYFLKLILKKLEQRGIEVCDQLYQKYVDLLNKDDNEEGTGSYQYKHYRLPNNEYITLSEKTSIISDGTTGLCSWQGARALTNWLWENKSFIKGKNILELGSGIGLAGLSLLSFCDPSNFYFSDCHSEVLKQLLTNVKLNLERCEDAGQDCGSAMIEDSNLIFWKTMHRGIDVRILNLPWESVVDDKPNIRPDVIMASDVVYDSSLFGSLIDTLVYFLKQGTYCAIFVCTVRNETTLESFIELAGGRELIVTELPEALPSLGYFDSDTPIKTFRITSSL